MPDGHNGWDLMLRRERNLSCNLLNAYQCHMALGETAAYLRAVVMSNWSSKVLWMFVEEIEACVFYEIGWCWNLNAVSLQSSERHSRLHFVLAMPCRRISSPGRCLNPHRHLCRCLQGIQPRSCDRAGPFPSRYLLIKISMLTSRIGHSLSIFVKCIKIAKILRTMYWLIFIFNMLT